jgi:methylenetetrahydrofolate reductase (NADPH)
MSARTYSFEFFPPKTPEGTVKLRNVRTQLAALKPDYFSVTFGAGGSTREGTWNSVVEIHQAGLPAAPHISCVGSSRALISKLLRGYQEAGIRRLVALRGDAPSGTGIGGGELTYACELVEFVREQTGDWFHIDVAAYPEYHPQARSPGSVTGWQASATIVNRFARSASTLCANCASGCWHMARPACTSTR